MKGVPPEIDALMWQLAEDGGPIAQAEFEQRYTRYAPELSRRIRMVSELRAAGKTVAHRPSFTLRPVRVLAPPRWTIGAAAGLAVFAVGAVAYLAASGDERSPIHPPTVPKPKPVPTVNVMPPVVTPPPVVRKEPPVLQKPPEEKPIRKPKYLEPQDVQIADTNLSSAINLVAAGGGLKVELAPGFEDKSVTFDYRGSGLNTIEILKVMGEQYGFSIFEQEEGRILAIPARPADDTSRRVGP